MKGRSRVIVCKAGRKMKCSLETDETASTTTPPLLPYPAPFPLSLLHSSAESAWGPRLTWEGQRGEKGDGVRMTDNGITG